MDDSAKRLVSLLREKGLKIACAESCTGGLVAKLIVDVAGASEVFDCGIVSYGNNIKMKLLGVKSETLAGVGAVSRETALQMADGAAALAEADLAVSTTGVAGPSGGTPEKPVGTVWFGLSYGGKSYAVKKVFDRKPGRGYVRDSAAQFALLLACKALEGTLSEDNL